MNTALENCMEFVGDDDVIILIEDGVYAAAAKTAKSNLVERILNKNKVFALQADLRARGIESLIESVDTVGYEIFVDLIEQHTTQSWL
ncbi:MAG: sulfurtransferase complex subunit TusB [Gammaproteobacteria bacterium]|nr:MAG: sulfurtransferase complex subunit TusB [Gammaproteobacteria bacterium]